MAPQTAHSLNGSGLLPWSGGVKQTFEQQYAALLKARGIGNSGIAYVGSVVSSTSRYLYVDASAADRGLQDAHMYLARVWEVGVMCLPCHAS